MKKLKKLKKNIHNNKGFTLIEIMAILIILGVIAGVAVPKLINMDKHAEDTKNKYNENIIERMAIQEYYLLEDKTETLEEYVQRRIEEERK